MPTSEEQTNLAVISEYFSEFWGKANPDIVDKLCADNFVINYPMHGPRYGKEAAKKMLSEFKEVRTDGVTEVLDKAAYIFFYRRHSPTFPSVPTSTL